MKRFLGTLTVGLLLSLVAITVVGGVAFGAIVGSRLQAEDMTRSSTTQITIQSDPDGSGPAGSNLRWEAGSNTSVRASITITPNQQVNQIQTFVRQVGTNEAFAFYVDGVKVGTVTPPSGGAWGLRTIDLASPISPVAAGQQPHQLQIGPNATLANRANVDWFELHNTGSTDGDTTPPAAPTITGGPAEGGTDSDGNVSFSFTGAESGGTFECSNVPQGQAANYSACTSPKPYSGFANGSYTFSVRQKDAAGNVGAAATRNYSVSISTPPPAAACADTLDNDGDELVDLNDPGCDDAADNDETDSTTPPTDTDGDGVADTSDNCPNVANLDQADSDGDGVGDACETVEPPQGAIFAGAGDIADVGDADVTTGNILEGLGPGAIAWTSGDNAYPNGTLDHFNTKYEPAWGSFKARTWPTPGNHDYRTTNASGYKSYFDAGDLEQATPDGSVTYHAKDIGGWRWYFLDSNIGATTSSAQYGWLQQDLNANVSPGECVGAIWHHPVVSTGEHGSLAKMRAIFALLDQAAYDADLILEGHDHNYERFAKHSSTGAASASGIQSVVVGTGGTEHRAFTTIPLPVTVERNADTHGVLVGELTPTGGSFEFFRANYSGNGNFTDQFTVSCN